MGTENSRYWKLEIPRCNNEWRHREDVSLSKDITVSKGAMNEWYDSVSYSEGNDPLYRTLLTHGGNVADYMRRVKNIAQFDTIYKVGILIY
jgi:hypothetical protein